MIFEDIFSDRARIYIQWTALWIQKQKLLFNMLRFFNSSEILMQHWLSSNSVRIVHIIFFSQVIFSFLLLYIDWKTFADGAGVFFISVEDNISVKISTEDSHFSREPVTVKCYGRAGSCEHSRQYFGEFSKRLKLRANHKNAWENQRNWRYVCLVLVIAKGTLLFL